MSEITYEFIRDYLKAIQKEDNEVLEKIREDAISNNVPIIKLEVKQFLQMFLSIIRPKKILEIGTAVGYSSIIMSEYLEDNGSITTIERMEEMALKARENIKLVGKESVIHILEGDAKELLPTLKEEYDFIFMDAAKGQYITFFPYCMKLLKAGGVLVSDNVLQGGFVAKSRWSIPRRQRTIHQRMREYLWELNHNDRLKTSILPVADGLTISHKINL